MERNIVFDLDGVLVTPLDFMPEMYYERAEEGLGAEFVAAQTIDLEGFIHLVIPGAEALLRWLHDEGYSLSVFSSGLEVRNTLLVSRLLERAFPDQGTRPEVPIFSRNHTFESSTLDKEAERAYDKSCHWSGRRKKPLAGLVVSAEALPNTLFIEDDQSYAAPGEARNFVCVTYFMDYYPVKQTNWRVQKLHKPYYICGVLSRIREVADKDGIPLAEAAERVQATDEGEVLDRDFRFPSKHRFELYERGLEVLKRYDPSLKFLVEWKDEEGPVIVLRK